jgi:hypothetical protein
MSEENVELVQRVVEDFNATGQLGPEFDALIHPQVKFEDEIGAYNSRNEVRAFLEGFAQAIGGLHVERRIQVGLRTVDRHDAILGPLASRPRIR